MCGHLNIISKLTQALHHLPAKFGFLIDDGVDAGGQQKAPINQGQMQQQQPQAGQPAQVAQQSYSPAGNVGQLMTSNQAFSVLPQEMSNSIGGGAVASGKNSRVIVWSHSGEEVNSRVATASTRSKDNYW